MFEHYANCFKKYIDFAGRATRSEYWYFVLVNLIVSIVLSILSVRLQQIYSLVAFIPSWSVLWRRLPDTNRSGLNFFWMFLPIVGWIVLIVFLAQPTVPGPNKYVKE